MKKIYTYLVTACLALGFTACNSDDPTEASSKHVYAADEAPYLRTNLNANVAVNLEFPLANIDEPQEISLKDYASYFHQNLDMTVDETLAAFDSGDVVFYNINATGGCWNLTEPNAGSTGWNYNALGVADASNAVASVTLDRSAKKLVVKMFNSPSAGTIVTSNLGFAIKNGKDFDDYVRFSITMTVTDPGKVITSLNLDSSVGYDCKVISFDDFAEDIEFSMGMTIDDFCEMADNTSEVTLYMEDATTSEWLTEYESMREGTTGGVQGYWLDSNLLPTTWSGSGYPDNLFFIESYGVDDRGVYIGLAASGVAAGTSKVVRFVYVLNSDPTRNVEFIVSVNVE